ncbi:MAG: Gfo/Idh/MocA family oxidoreductase [Clostridia bacterium]|nr:Gfo/Idh/MocA family oxidoreductase [Clostridia bacterium]
MLKACVIGCGCVGPVHMQAIKDLENADLYAVCDNRPERADKAAETYGAKAYYSIEEVLADKEIDIVHIATPHYLHVDMAIAALSAGKNVVLEKPVAISREDLERLSNAEKASDKKVCVTLQNRYFDNLLALRELVKDSEKTGKLLGVTGIITWDRGETYYKQDPPWRGHWETEGGSLMCNQAMHLIDLMHVFAGPAERVYATISNKRLKGIIETEDTAEALIEFKSGVRGVFFGANTYTGSKPIQLELDFENVRYRYADQRLYTIYPDGNVEVSQKDCDKKPGKAVWGNGHYRVITDFYNSLTEGGYYLSLSEILPSAKTLLALYESGKAGGVWTAVE